MLKMVGALIVISCCSMIGMGYAAGLKTRSKSLTGLIAAIAFMKSEICELLTPLPELLEILTDRSDGAVREFFVNVLREIRKEDSKGFAESWRSAVLGSGEMRLSAEDVLVLCELGASLGRYDVSEQKNALTRAENRLEESLKRAEDDRRSRGKLCAAMGISAGLMIAIIML